jgi:small subunit ribosomal protein S8
MDPIANFLISLKNGGMASRPSVTVPYSKIKHEIAELLSKKGFVGAVSKKGKKKLYLEVALNYISGRPGITDVKRISKSSRRIYKKAKEIYPYKSGIGSTFLSTPKGILADIDAKKQNLGGEVLFSIY